MENQPSREEIIQEVSDTFAPIAYLYRNRPEDREIAIQEAIEIVLQKYSSQDGQDENTDTN